MYCPHCGLAMPASRPRCPHCGESVSSTPTQLARAQQIHPQKPATKALEVAPKSRSKTLGFGAALVVLSSIAGLFFLQNRADWREKLQDGLQKTRVALAPTPENCGAMAPDECRWVAEANRILRSSLAIEKRQGEAPAARLARMSANIGAAKADYTLLPPVPTRCFAAKSLLSRALAEARISVTLAQKALDPTPAGTKPPTSGPLAETIQSANRHRERAGALYLACASELERLFNSPEAAPPL